MADAGDVQPGGGGLRRGLVAAGETPPATELGEAALDLPQRADGLGFLGLVGPAPGLDGDGDLVAALHASDERLDPEFTSNSPNPGTAGQRVVPRSEVMR